MALTFYDIPNDIIRELLCHYLSPDDVYKCLLTSKIFHIMLPRQLYHIIQPFWYDCIIKGSLLTCMKIYQLSIDVKQSLNIHKDNDFAFRESCKNGYLEVVKWLYDVGLQLNSPINIHEDEERAFRWSCWCGHLEVSKWLYDLSLQLNSPINIHVIGEHAFRWSCMNGYLEVAKWLCSLCDKYSIKIDNGKINYVIEN
jgi:hypothetical protein